MKKRYLPLIPVIALSLAGCTGPDGPIPTKTEVLEYVEDVCGNEAYILAGHRLVEKTPDNMEYTFYSRDRDLTFHANSYLSPNYFDASIIGYSQEISCDYVEQVREQYQEEGDQVLSTAPSYNEEKGWFYVTSYEELEPIADTILTLDQVWEAELAYNDRDFLKENPLYSFHIVWTDDPANLSDWTNLTDLSVTGSNTREDLMSDLSGAYLQAVTDGTIPDTENLPTYGHHVSRLDTITLDGREMTYQENTENPLNDYGLTTDDYRYAWYSEEEHTYLIPMDVGLVSDSMSFPMINREYVIVQNGTYNGKAMDDAYETTWTIGDNTWVLSSTFTDGDLDSLSVTKNGVEMPLSYVTVYKDSEVRATFLAGVPVEEFAELFNLDVTVDEERKTLEFYTR